MRYAVNGTVLNVVEQGTGDLALVFLHYCGGSARSWREVMDRLADQYHCVAPDLRGFGDSEAPANGYSVNNMAEDIAALIQALGLKRYALVGHSMGGKVALALAMRRLAGLESLILLTPSPPTPEPLDEAERERLLSSHPSRSAAEATLQGLVTHSLFPLIFEQAVQDNLKSSCAPWQAWFKHGSREDISAQLSCINVPVLVVTGTDDKNMTPALLERTIIARVPDAQLQVVFRAGHLLPLEVPDTVANLIHRFASAGSSS